MVEETFSTVTNRLDPNIEAYRLGLLGDVQGYTRDQIFGRNVQELRNQGVSPEDIARRLGTGTAGSGVEGEEGYVPPSADFLSPEDLQQKIGDVSQTAMYGAPDYQVAGLSPSERAATVAAQQGVGAYQPYLTSGAQSLQGATGMIANSALPYMQQGIAALQGSDQQYDPSAAQGIAQRGMNQLGQTTAQYDPSATIANTYGSMADMAQTTGQYDTTGTVANTYGAMGDMAGTTGAYDPASARNYMNEYEDQAVQQALADVARAGQMQQSQLGANAVGAGAFGGARQGVAQAEIAKSTLEQQGRTAAGMRQAGYESAAQRSQEAFERQQGRGQTAAQQRGAMGLAAGQFDQGAYESAMGRGQTAAQQRAAMGLSAGQFDQGGFESAMGRRANAAQQGAALGMSAEQFAASGLESAMGRRQGAAGMYGSMGQGIGQLGAQLGQMGIQQAGLGEMYQGMNARDIQNLMTTGTNERQVQQAGLDANRMSNLQRYTQPMQQYGFLSDIYSGTPSGSSTLTASSAPQTSPFQTAVGVGIAGTSAVAGAAEAGIL
jgi:hypothetical protein|tara:strand:+ start:1127 stop:2773 length:1647 start_codon:yes stop_codon:yes gene_type:complete